MWVQALIAAGYQVYAINPLSVAAYRDRHNVAGAKSDPGDAKVLADLVRTDRHNHRPIAGDSDEASGLKVLARAHQNLIWDRTRHTNRLRNDLREFFPAALNISKASPTQTPRSAEQSIGSRHRSTTVCQSDPRSAETWWPPTQPRHPSNRDPDALAIPNSPRPAITVAFAATTRALISVIAGLNQAIAELETELANHFEQHPDADIYLSLPGLGVVLGARVLGEFGDDPERYDTAKSRRNYAGTSPLTDASGKKHIVQARHIRNRRLYDAIDQWAFCTTNTKPRLPGLLRPTTSRRRPPPPSPPSARQPTRRLPPRLPQNPHPLRRTHRLGPPTTQNPDRCLTTYNPGMSKCLDLERSHAPMATVRRLGAERAVVRGGVNAATDYGADLIAGGEAEVYIRASKVADLVDRYAVDLDVRSSNRAQLPGLEAMIAASPDVGARRWYRFEPHRVDRFAGPFVVAVGAVVDASERGRDVGERLLDIGLEPHLGRDARGVLRSIAGQRVDGAIGGSFSSDLGELTLQPLAFGDKAGVGTVEIDGRHHGILPRRVLWLNPERSGGGSPKRLPAPARSATKSTATTMSAPSGPAGSGENPCVTDRRRSSCRRLRGDARIRTSRVGEWHGGGAGIGIGRDTRATVSLPTRAAPQHPPRGRLAWPPMVIPATPLDMPAGRSSLEESVDGFPLDLALHVHQTSSGAGEVRCSCARLVSSTSEVRRRSDQ